MTHAALWMQRTSVAGTWSTEAAVWLYFRLRVLVFAEKSSELVSTLLHIHNGSCPVRTHTVLLIITVHFHG